MFGRFMNNYYYGKSGKGDFLKEDLPETRMQLFRDTLRTRLSGLCRLNLIYAIAWIPAALVLLLNVSNLWNRVQTDETWGTKQLQSAVDSDGLCWVLVTVFP